MVYRKGSTGARRAGRPAAVWCGLLLAASAHAGQQYDFEVLLDGKPIGRHGFQIDRGPGGIEQVVSTARFDVKILGLTVYRYRHDATERWRDGCLVAIEARTRDNGEELQVMATEQGGALHLQAPRTESRSGCVSAYAYWDRDRLLAQRELLNPQTGVFDAVRIEPAGDELLDVRGVQYRAQRYRLRGEALSIDLWYSAEGEWLQLASVARGGRQLLYRPAR